MKSTMLFFDSGASTPMRLMLNGPVIHSSKVAQFNLVAKSQKGTKVTIPITIVQAQSLPKISYTLT